MQQQQQLQQTQMQPQLQQPQMQQPQLQQQQLQQSPMQQQQPQQTVAATMPMGNSVEQNNHMNVTTSVPINVATLNVSQPQMQTLQQTVNTSTGASVQMAVPQLTAQAQTVQASNMMSQSSAPYTTIHPTMTMSQSPLQQVQVMQQPISASYLQHLYPQQQFLLPGNLTLQHGMAGPTLQSIGATQGLSLQLQAAKTLDPKTSMGGQLQAVNTNKAMAVNTGTMMTTSGQVIGAAGPKANFPQQMIATPGKQTIIHSQTGFTNQAPNQTVVIGQLGVIPNQQAIFNQKALADSQKGKTFTFHNQQATLQPKSLYSSAVPVHSTAQVFNGSHMKPIGTQSQILTSQAPATMLSNAQLFGLSAAFPQGLSWSPAGNLQLANNQPIIIQQRQQSTDMFIQSPSQSAMQIPVATATAPIPPTTYAPTPLAPSKPKQVRFATQTVAVATQTIVTTAATMNSNTNPLRAQVRPKGRYSAASSPIAPSTNAPRMATTQTQTNQSHSQPPAQLPSNAQQKSDAGNQTHTSQVKPVTTPESKSISTQSKSVGAETKQHLSPQPPLKSQAMIAPSTKAQNTVSPTISTSLPPVTSCDVTTTTTSTVSSTVTPTNTVLPSMPIITTFAAVAPTPSAPITSVTVTDNLTVTPKMSAAVSSQELEESVDDPPESEPPVEMECETLKPQPILKPNLSPVKEKQPQKAIVKPQILTHVIDGFVIQEGPEPFPVSRSALLDSSYRVMAPEKPKKIEDSPTAASPEKKRNTVHRPRGNVELAKCEFCGKMGPKYKFKRSKRFCSTSCAKRYNVCYSKGVGLLPSSNQENVAAGRKKKQGFKGRRGRKQSLTDQDLENSPVQMEVVPEPKNEEPLITSIKVEEDVGEVPMDVSHQNVTQAEKAEEVEIVEVESSVMRKLPTKWTVSKISFFSIVVQEVFEFIRDLPGCSDYADTFKSQEIDGQALLLLKEDHLMTSMSMKLGPALKLISQINSIKEETWCILAENSI
ncbi:LOW QUALITY PROTEIN: polyhomeotic-like protein 2 [Uloborus diversus]|uniref:LOW QUALITY PROTEIN: polyhomeotic-like protein 2 n=1 Tax=Uloborus diversus TaxID=327109 RepID=UPI0024091E30|nr:LOW QUALITY PROTEIN: polyhomeotic-like protein 2 [Uloborus diversus]